MRLGRLVLVVATLVAILVFPLVMRDAVQALRLPNAYAAPIAVNPIDHVYQDNDNDDEDNDDNEGNDENDNEGESGDNDNVECFASLNSNEEVPCVFEENENAVTVRRGAQVVRRAGESLNRPTKCFDAREVGVVQMGTGTYDVTVQVMPHSSFNQTTRLTLRDLDAGSVPAPPGSLVDDVVFALDAQSSCDGAAINPLPNLVNLGIVYNVPVAVDKARLQIVRLEGGSWVNVDTVPDPVAGNPYVSATINTAGTYALVQR